MKRTSSLVAFCAFGMLTGLAAAQGSKPVGKLTLFADTDVFAGPTNPDNCTLRNRFKHGENVGFRLYAIDGGTSKTEESATVVVHITIGGRTYNVPAKYRGIAQKDETGVDMPIHPGMWTAKWTVPDDAPTGTVQYSATAKDKYGRIVEWTPPGDKRSFLTIVQ
jgi:hypothetical protein